VTTASTTPAVTGAIAGDSDLDLQPGQVVGEYVVEARLGRGGFGAVFKAAHPLIGKVVAIKVLARRFSADPDMVERFQAEARAVNQIRHRNIIDIFSFGTLPDGRAFYVMEYLDGETLGARLARDGRLALAVAVPILRAIGRALEAAHAQGIAHRDLKPENVFLAADSDGGEPMPKLLDFGVAKLLRPDDGAKSKTQSGVPIGTPLYMSPEQCRGRAVDHRTDYYAFGVVAYQLLTGVVPIDGEDYMTVLMNQISIEPVPASTRCGELPPAVDDVIAWLMRKDPAERPPSLTVAVQALEAAAGLAPATRATPSSVSVPPAPRASAQAFAQTAPSLEPVRAVAMATGSATVPPTLYPPTKKRSAGRTLALVIQLVGALSGLAWVLYAIFGSHHDDDDAPTESPPPAIVAPAPSPVAPATPSPSPSPSLSPSPPPSLSPSPSPSPPPPPHKATKPAPIHPAKQQPQPPQPHTAAPANPQQSLNSTEDPFTRP
jgi:serine/threonine-protein kinase